MNCRSFRRLAVVLALAAGAPGASPAAADVLRYRAWVYVDRSAPEQAVIVDDFRVNETVWDEGGVQYVRVRGRAGTYQLFFDKITQIEMVKYLGLVDTDWAKFEVKVTGKPDDRIYTGTMELRVMRGVAYGSDWHLFPAGLADRGANVWRIVFGNGSIEPTLSPMAEPAKEPAKPAGEFEVVPRPVPGAVPGEAVTGRPAAPLAGLSEEERFRLMSLEELNTYSPLEDVYFDFDRSDLRPDAQASLRKNAAWLLRFPSTRVRIEGHADPRGTHEYNVRLGQQRANAIRAFLVSLGVPAARLESVTLNADARNCLEQTEQCWALNRRGHFVFTAK